LKCGEIFTDRFIADFLKNLPVKEFLKSPIFGEDMDKSMMIHFFTHDVQNFSILSVVTRISV